jgi:RimJ/RimL family protein N-acetyltransferase
MTARIREPELADAEELARVHAAAWEAAYDGLMPADFLAGLVRDVDRRVERWRRTISNRVDDRACLLAENADTGEILGFVTVGPPRDEGVPDGTGELYAINLAPSAWGTGAGATLFTAGVGWLAERYERGYLWVVDGNERAQRFYVKHGWAPDGGSKIDDRGNGVELYELRYSRTF